MQNEKSYHGVLRYTLTIKPNKHYEMKACPRVDENQVYISVLHTFQNVCKRFWGRVEEPDDKLAKLFRFSG